MARKLKRFFLFVFFSFFFTLLSGRSGPIRNSSEKGTGVSSDNKGWNSAQAECCMNGVCVDEYGNQYCC